MIRSLYQQQEFQAGKPISTDKTGQGGYCNRRSGQRSGRGAWILLKFQEFLMESDLSRTNTLEELLISPGQKMERIDLVRMKLSPIPSVIQGKRCSFN